MSLERDIRDLLYAAQRDVAANAPMGQHKYSFACGRESALKEVLLLVADDRPDDPPARRTIQESRAGTPERREEIRAAVEKVIRDHGRSKAAMTAKGLDITGEPIDG